MDLFTPEAHTVSKTFLSGQTPVLRVSLCGPALSSGKALSGGETLSSGLAAPFNRYNEELVNAQFRRAETTLFSRAEKDLEAARWDGRPFYCHVLRSDFRLHLITDRHISLYRETYTYSGGVHGHSTATAQTWDLRQGLLLPLSELFAPGFPFEERLIAAVTAEARRRQRQGLAEFYPGLPRRVRTYFDPRRYYVTASGLAVFFPLYALVPYEAGISSFTIPFHRFGKSFLLPVGE